MTQQMAKPSFINNSARCTYRFANGKRCRLSGSNIDSAFCPSHASLPENQREPADTAAFLTTDLKEFRSAIPINDFLARLSFSSPKTKSLPVVPPSSLTSPINSSAPSPPSTANSIPKKIPTNLPRSSATCPVPSRKICPNPSPPADLRT